MKTLSLLTLAVSTVVSTAALAEAKTYNLIGQVVPMNNTSQFHASSTVEMTLTYDRDVLTNAIIPGGILYHVDLTPENYRIEFSVTSYDQEPVVFSTEIPASSPWMPPMPVSMLGTIYPYFWTEEVRNIPMFTADPTGNPMPQVVNADFFIVNESVQAPAGQGGVSEPLFDDLTLRLIDLENLDLSIMGIQDQVMLRVIDGYSEFTIEFSSITVDGNGSTSAELNEVCAKLNEVCSMFPYSCDATSTNAFDVLSNVCGLNQQ